MANEKRPRRTRRRHDGEPCRPAGDRIPAETNDPVSPKGMSDDEAQRLQDQAIELVEQLREAAGSAEMELLDGVTNVGLQAQRNSASQLGLLSTRVSTFLNAGGASKDIAEGLRDLAADPESDQPPTDDAAWDH